MADISAPAPRRFRLDGAWILAVLLPLAVALADPAALLPLGQATAGSFLHTLPFLLLAVLAVAWLKATGAESLLARAFEGRETRMIVLAALVGGLSPFCSCQVIPFVAAMLALGAPLSAVMAFWLASPLMDPPMFLITAGALGLPFALAKTAAAVALGLSGGFFVRGFARSALFTDPLKNAPVKSCSCGDAPALVLPGEAPAKSCCGPADGTAPFSQRPVWSFWRAQERRQAFLRVGMENLLFLGKWLLVAYMLEALMLRYVPADLVAGVVGGNGPLPVVLAALVGAPAYLNGYAAVPLVAGLLQQGMSQGAAMAFVLAGGVSCIPAAVAVWALVKPRVFAAYLGLAFAGSLAAGFGWGMLAPLLG